LALTNLSNYNLAFRFCASYAIKLNAGLKRSFRIRFTYLFMSVLDSVLRLVVICEQFVFCLYRIRHIFIDVKIIELSLVYFRLQSTFLNNVLHRRIH